MAFLFQSGPRERRRLEGASSLKAIAFLLFIVFGPTGACQSAHLDEAGKSVQIDTLPAVFESNKIFVTVYVAGAPFQFVFDTGAEISIVSASFPGGEHLKALDSSITVIDPMQNHVSHQLFALDSLQISHSFLRNVTVLSSDLTSFSNLACRRIDGILGYDVLRQFQWRISESGAIHFSKDAPFVPGKDFKVAGLIKSSSKLPLLQMQVCGQEIPVLFDTGSDQVLSVNDDIADRCSFSSNIIEGRGLTANTVAGTGSGRRRKTTLPSVEIGRNKLENVEASISGKKRQALLGAGFLRHRNLILDFPSGVVYYSEVTSRPVDSVFFTSPGLSLGLFGTQVKVAVVWNGSAADESGIQPGDTVFAIDGRPTIKITAEEWCALKKRINGSSTLQLSIRNAQTQHIGIYNLPVRDLRRSN